MKKVRELRGDELDRDGLSPADQLEADEAAGTLAGPPGVEVFRRMLTQCLPPKAYGRRMGSAAHWKAGYRRMVAMSYVVAPELFNGMSRREVAAALGISFWAFRKQLRQVAEMIADREQAGRARRPRAGAEADELTDEST